MSFYVTRLAKRHDRSGFRCGRPQLDDWLQHYGRQSDMRSGSSRTFVLVDDEIDDGRCPLGFYSLAAHAVLLSEAPEELVSDQPSYPHVSAVLLTRLAIDERYQGRGLGQMLLAEALRKTAGADERVAVVLFVVDAIDDDAAAFYAHYGFRRLPGQARRLRARVKDIRMAFGI